MLLSVDFEHMGKILQSLSRLFLFLFCFRYLKDGEIWVERKWMLWVEVRIDANYINLLEYMEHLVCIKGLD